MVQDATQPVTGCPCLCGCPCHLRAVCPCGCPSWSPDYVAAASAELAQLPDEARKAREAQLRAASEDMANQLRYRGPPRPGKARVEVERTCEYCLGTFHGRKHAKTCSGACRQARSKALQYETDADVPGPLFRREEFSAERLRATGYGWLLVNESYQADLRVRRIAREQGTTETASED